MGFSMALITGVMLDINEFIFATPLYGRECFNRWWNWCIKDEISPTWHLRPDDFGCCLAFYSTFCSKYCRDINKLILTTLWCGRWANYYSQFYKWGNGNWKARWLAQATQWASGRVRIRCQSLLNPNPVLISSEHAALMGVELSFYRTHWLQLLLWMLRTPTNQTPGVFCWTTRKWGIHS